MISNYFRKFGLAIISGIAILSCSSSYAYEADPSALITKVLDGQLPFAQAEITGEFAKLLQTSMQTSALPVVKAENVGKFGSCVRVKLTTTLDNIAHTVSPNSIKYETSSLLSFCPGDKLPPGVKKIELLSCTIGGKPCPSILPK